MLQAQTGHAGAITAIAFAADGHTIASASRDGTIRLWDAASGAELRVLTGHSRDVVGLRFGDSGSQLYTQSWDRTVRVWDVATGASLRTLETLGDGARPLTPLPRDRLLSLEADGRTLAVRDAGSGAVRFRLAGHTAEVDAYDWVLDAAGRRLVSQGRDRALRVWDLEAGRALSTISQRAAALAISPDGTIVAASGFALQLWDASTGRPLRTLTRYREEAPPGSGAGLPGAALAFSPDGATLAAVASDGAIRLWDVASGTQRLDLGCCRRFNDAIAFSPDGRVLAASGSAQVLQSWELSHPGAPFPTRVVRKRTESLFGIAFSPDGRRLIVGHDHLFESTMRGAAFEWDLVSGRTPRPLPGEQRSARQIVVSADGSQIASGGLDNAIVLRDGAEGRVLRTIDVGEPVDRLAASRDGRRLAMSSRNGTVRLFDAASGRESARIAAHDVVAWDVALSPDGRTLVSSGRDRQVKIWDATSGRLQRAFEHTAQHIAISPDGRRVALCNPRALALLDVTSGAALEFPPGAASDCRVMGFSRDGRLLATGDGDERVRIWDVERRALRATLAGHSDDVFGLSFSPDSRVLATASLDGTARLWDASAGAALATLIRIDDTDWLVVTPDGLFDGSPAAWSAIQWRFSPQLRDLAPLELFFSEFFRPGLLTELLAGARPRAPRDLAQIDRRPPRVRLATRGLPPDGAIPIPRIQLELEVDEAAAGARDLRLFRNGTLVKAWRGELLRGRPAATLQVEVPIVAGENRFTAYAFNRDNVKSPDATVLVTGHERRLRRVSTTRVLAIAVDRYANAQFDLRYAGADALEFTAELERQQRRIDPGALLEVSTLRDQGATRAALLEALRQLASRSQPVDNVFVFFAGHGIAVDERFYLVPHDMGFTGSRDALDARGLALVARRSVSDRDLEAAFEGIDARRIVLIIDACHSGQALDAAERRRGPMNNVGLAQLAYEKGMYVLTAAQSHQAALELSELQHGLLTYALVEDGLKRGAADSSPPDGTIHLREWLDFATARVPQMQRERMRLAAGRGLKIAYVGGEERIEAVEDRNVQRPRVYYRRELEADPLVISAPSRR